MKHADGYTKVVKIIASIAVFAISLTVFALTKFETNSKKDIVDTGSPYAIRSLALKDSAGNLFSGSFTKIPNVSDYMNSGSKPALYAASDDTNLILVSGKGQVFLQTNFAREVQKMGGVIRGNTEQSSGLKQVDSNLQTFFDDQIFFGDSEQNGWFSVKGLLLHENEVYVSYSRRHEGPCWNTGILKGLILNDKVEFSDFWVNAECARADYENFTAHQAGGAMLFLGPDRILFTQGDYKQYSLVQDSKSIFGKLFLIEGIGSNQKTKILAKGFRNAQGMTQVGSDIFIADQGPKGGDEVNIYNLSNEENAREVNFGWPISSYGEHYDGLFREDSPMYKSHEKYGFVEPAIYYVPSIATSSVTSVDFKVNGRDVLAIGALVGTSIHFVESTGDNKLEPVSILEMPSRVRSVSSGPNECILVSLDTGEVGLVCKLK